jgi:hypothetical protein
MHPPTAHVSSTLLRRIAESRPTTIRLLTFGTVLAASALLLGPGSPTVVAASKARSFEVDFNKCFAHDGYGPYVFTFAGRVTGDVFGTVEARLLTFTPGIETDEDYIEADYVVEGTLPFTARVGGRENTRTNLAVLRGYVSAGPSWLIGAGVLDEFKNYVKKDGTGCSKGTLYITPKWKQTESDR